MTQNIHLRNCLKKDIKKEAEEEEQQLSMWNLQSRRQSQNWKRSLQKDYDDKRANRTHAG